MKKENVLTLKEMSLINGGRSVVKEDLNGDGRWDIKTVVTTNKIKTVIRDSDGNRVVTKLRLA